MPDGNVAFTGAKLTVNDEFIESAKKGRSPEARFRFADKCVQGLCKQWTVHAAASLTTQSRHFPLRRYRLICHDVRSGPSAAGTSKMEKRRAPSVRSS
jgi:hypothetical protein